MLKEDYPETVGLRIFWSGLKRINPCDKPEKIASQIKTLGVLANALDSLNPSEKRLGPSIDDLVAEYLRWAFGEQLTLLERVHTDLFRRSMFEDRFIPLKLLKGAKRFANEVGSASGGITTSRSLNIHWPKD